jgi:hypothetical protein
MRTIAMIAAAAGLAACQGGPKPVDGICKAFPATAPAATQPAAATEDCLHRWAYALAGSRDDAGAVADAAVAACGTPLSRWNQLSLSAAAPEAPSLLTGQPSNPILEHANFARSRSLFYVVQARAGGCKPPPKRQGAAAMTAPDA